MKLHSEPGELRGIDLHLTQVRQTLKRVSPTASQASFLASESLLVDIRPVESRLQHGVILGALVIDRNTLEWRLDPSNDHRLKIIDAYAEKEVPVILFCNDGYASSLAAHTLNVIGLKGATDMVGGFNEWKRLGLPWTA